MKAQEHKELKKYGGKLGREKLALRIIEICKEVAVSEDYKDAFNVAGKIQALAIACSCDEYASEHRDNGYYSEIYELKTACRIIER